MPKEKIALCFDQGVKTHSLCGSLQMPHCRLYPTNSKEFLFSFCASHYSIYIPLACGLFYLLCAIIETINLAHTRGVTNTFFAKTSKNSDFRKNKNLALLSNFRLHFVKIFTKILKETFSFKLYPITPPPHRDYIEEINSASAVGPTVDSTSTLCTIQKSF